jgi:dTDP-4-amino-4,6-dideoxygalactose transaminase/GNAT superfamily N-acetyltransferase
MTTPTIPLFKVQMNENAVGLVSKTLASGMITQAKMVEEFETKLKEYFNHPFVLTLNSATAGLTLAHRLLGVGHGDKVISTPLTCFATNAAILANQADIVWADVDEETCNIDLDDVKNKLTKNTKAVSFVHWGGNPVDMSKVEELKQYAKTTFGTELGIVEDCAHAFGAEYNNKKLGTFGNIAVFSFQAIKHLTTGDGGLIIVPNKDMYDRAKLLRWYGIDRENRSKKGTDFRLEDDIVEYGYKFHMNDINASIGLANLPVVDTIIKRCRSNAEFYDKEFNNIHGIEKVKVSERANPSYWIYTIKILHNKKKDFQQYMKEKGIVVSQVHSRNDKNTCVSKYQSKLPQLDRLEKQIISIPVGWWVTEKGREYIANSIHTYFTKNSVTIRKLLPTELHVYKDLLKEMNNYIDHTKTSINDKLTDKIYVVVSGSQIVSTAKLWVEDKVFEPVGHIEDVVTFDKYRGKGYGKLLVKNLNKIALESLNCYKVVLSCKEGLNNFYESCGMKQNGVSFAKYKDQ